MTHMMDVFLEEVDALPENAVLYCWGWWQEPDVKLLLGKDMVDLQRTERRRLTERMDILLSGGDLTTSRAGRWRKAGRFS